MKFATYLLLVGAAAAQECASQAKVDAFAARAVAAAAYADAVALKTPEVLTFETGLQPLQDHVNAMTTALKVAQAGKSVVEDVTAAQSNLTAAQAALDAHLVAAGNAALNKVLVDIATAKDAQDAAFKVAFDAINSCVPDAIKAYGEEMLAKMKTEKDYDNLSAEDKTAFDTFVTERKGKMAANDTKMKWAAMYHEMTADEQAMYDRMLLAQKQLKAEDDTKFQGKMDEEKIREKFADMTPEQQAEWKKKMMEQKKDFMGRKDKDEMDDNEMRSRAGYFKDMTPGEKGVFDKKMGDFRKGRGEDDDAWMAKMKAMKDGSDFKGMTDDKKMGMMKGMMDDRNKDHDRKNMYNKQDMEQMDKMGYFKKMNDSERGIYDKKQGDFSKGRKDQDDMWDSLKGQFQKSGAFGKMDGGKQGQFMQKFDQGRDMWNKQGFKDRQDDDDLMKKMNYFKMDDSTRGKQDLIMQKKQGDRSMGRMAPGEGGIGSSCLSMKMMEGGRGMSMDAMKKKMGMDKPPMGMKGGEGKPPMGMKGRRLQEETTDEPATTDEEAATDEPTGEKDDVEMGEMMKQMMGDKGPKMMDGMMEKMMGKEGMMGKGEMTKEDMMGKMKGMWEQKMGAGKKGMMEFKDGKMGIKDMPPQKGGGCMESLCCGNVLKNGVWGTDYICNKATAMVYEDFRFQCVEGAKYIAGGAMSLIATAYLMA